MQVKKGSTAQAMARVSKSVAQYSTPDCTILKTSNAFTEFCPLSPSVLDPMKLHRCLEVASTFDHGNNTLLHAFLVAVVFQLCW
jgi:hypothetical protein